MCYKNKFYHRGTGSDITKGLHGGYVMQIIKYEDAVKGANSDKCKTIVSMTCTI